MFNTSYFRKSARFPIGAEVRNQGAENVISSPHPLAHRHSSVSGLSLASCLPDFFRCVAPILPGFILNGAASKVPFSAASESDSECRSVRKQGKSNANGLRCRRQQKKLTNIVSHSQFDEKCLLVHCNNFQFLFQ